MVDLARVLASRDVASLKVAVANAFEELSIELENAEKIADMEIRVKTLEDKQ